LQYAYGGDHLYYAYFDGTSWTTEVADSSPEVGAYASIAVDSDNRPHIAYYDATNGTLKYATKYSGSWHLKTLDSFTLPTLASDDTRGPIDPELIVSDSPPATRPWLDTAQAEYFPNLMAPSAVIRGAGQYTSIAIDGENKIHISYYQFGEDRNYNKLKYIHGDGFSWDTPQIIQEPGSAGNKTEGKYTSIAISKDIVNGVTHYHPHIVFLDDDYDDARHAYIGEGGRWNWENIYDLSNPFNVGGWLSIAIQSDHTCHVSFYDASHGKLRYARRPNCNKPVGDSNWDKPILSVDTNSVGKYTSLILDGSTPKISYFDETNDRLKLATIGGGTDVITGGTNIHAGTFTSLVKDGQKKLHVTYFDFGKGELYEAYQSNGWKFRKIDENHDVGYATSLALDSGDKPFISYLDASSNDLKLAWRSSAPPAVGTWSNDKLEPSYSLGFYTSVKIDSSGHARVAYYDSTNKDLKYAYWDTSTWVTTTVDRTGDVGQFASLALDVNDNPFISYYDATNKRLLYAYYNTTNWITATVDLSSLDVGQYTSIVVDNTPQPDTKVAISYYEPSSHNLKFAIKDPSLIPPPVGGWSKYWVDPTPDVDEGKFSSLAMTSTFAPRIAYYDATNKSLKYAVGTWNAGLKKWEFTNETVQKITDYDVGMYTSIVLDSLDRPNISYYSYYTKGSLDGDLRYAHKIGPLWDIHTVDSDGDVGYFTSIAVDSSDVPSISYYDKTEGELKYAYDPYLPEYFIFLPTILQMP
jgi:hypothetical protein